MRTKEFTVQFTDVTSFSTTNVHLMWRILATILSLHTMSCVKWKCMVSFFSVLIATIHYYWRDEGSLRKKWTILPPGCSNVGYYGPSCNKPCPINCQERRCDVNTGQCLGCVAGYQGQFCDQGMPFNVSCRIGNIPAI